MSFKIDTSSLEVYCLLLLPLGETYHPSLITLIHTHALSYKDLDTASPPAKDAGTAEAKLETLLAGILKFI